MVLHARRWSVCVGLAAILAVSLAPGVPGAGDAAVEPPAGSSTAAALSVTAPLRVDLYQPGDFVSQTNLVQCVGASMQMMQNIISGAADRTAATQHRLFELAVSLGDPKSPYAGGAHGASAQGWAAGLTSLGLGPYGVVAVATFDEAVALAARAIVSTRRPVGLLVWQGAHAWVLSGVEATADPTLAPSARISAVRVLDPLYPRPGGAWGATPAPDARLTLAQLARVFVPYRPYSRNAALRDRYVLVLPYDAPRLVGWRSYPV